MARVDHRHITLTSDWGLRDHFVATFKGMFYQRIPGVIITDVSHLVATGDIFRAAYTLQHTYHYFPAGTIHVCCVDAPSTSRQRSEGHITRYIMLEHEGHIFIGTDSGVFNLMFEEALTNVYELATTHQVPRTLQQELYVDTCARLFAGELPSSIGQATQTEIMALALRPSIDDNGISAHIIFIDSMGNIVTNINFALFESLRANRKFNIQFTPQYGTDEISKWYDDADAGEMVMLQNQAGYLELAINGGNAAKLLGFQTNSAVRVNFYNHNE